MKIPLTRAFGRAAAWTLLALPAGAHGAAYSPPAAPAPAAPSAPAPTSPAPAPGATGTGGRTTPPGPGAPVSPSGPLSVTDTSSWTWWWEFHKELYLDLKSHVHAGSVTSGSDGFFLGHGYRERERESPMRPTGREIHGRVVPALLRLLEEESSPHVVTGALVALAKIGEAGGPGDRVHDSRTEATLRRFLSHSSQEVAETATISLGILGLRGSAFLLGDLLLDARNGRAAVGKEEVPLRTRAFAAYALGVLGARSDKEDVRRYVVGRLTRALETDRTATRDLQVACVVALGRVPLAGAGPIESGESGKSGAPRLASSSREAQIEALLVVLRDRSQDTLVRAHVPVSLGLLLSGEPSLAAGGLEGRVARELIGNLTSRGRVPREIRQGCAIGLGFIGDDGEDDLDRRIRRALLGLGDSTVDRETRHQALIAAARTAARRGRGEPEGRAEVRSHLLSTLGRGSNDSVRWAALGLAILEGGLARAGRMPDPEVGAALRIALQDARSPLDVGAFAIALGILRDPEAGALLVSKLGRVREDQTRGHVAIALGLIDAREAIDAIRQLVEDSTYRPLVLREAATALGLLGDAQAVAILLDKLERASSLAAQASIAQALGRIGDTRTIEPLVRMVEDDSLTSGARAFAAVALGIVADRRPLPWNTTLSLGMNLAGSTPTLYDGQGLGVLNIL